MMLHSIFVWEEWREHFELTDINGKTANYITLAFVIIFIAICIIAF